VPTVAESALKGYDAGNWLGIFVPAATDRSIIERLNAAINKAMTTPDVKTRLESQGGEPVSGSPQELAQRVRIELARTGKIVKQAGIKAE
jgi:tripartite-type tricarboxylate transporter receptor subunit TctC